ncbi:fimbria/pilus periplasmic chaperone [Achromobacter sp. UMC46]|uniref:fimbria/pilus periplasmic chaperone n=1 Tax=Achromobacter sp. UMC46 TaxID=1862319 RepID=UPI001602EE83|nr:fimbria/pilus periplasmic chaperone [Achromobacter sp. UMC46]MBB1595791.1 molecular chaperone [Achromobacter sp. UMC46]
MNRLILKNFAYAALLCLFASQPALAAVSLDRTRIVFSGQDKSVSLNISNQNEQLPYLAQAWIENDKDEKITGPLVVLPPLQRLEPSARSQVKIQALPAANQLPQDRETLFYFNLREVPPRSDQANSLQIALQTRVKLFYRPQALSIPSGSSTAPWQERIRLMRQGDQYTVDNPTPYYVTLIDAAKSAGGSSIANFEPLMIPPHSQAPLNIDAGSLGNTPVLTYINDYGGRPKLEFRCSGQECTAKQISN